MGHGSVPQFPRSQVPGRRGYRERRDLGQAHRAPGHSLPSTRRRPRHGLLIATRVLRSSPLGRPWGQSGPRISGRWNGGIFCPVAAQAPCQEQPGPPGWPPAPRQGGARLAGRQGKGSWVLGRRQRGRGPRPRLGVCSREAVHRGPGPGPSGLSGSAARVHTHAPAVRVCMHAPEADACASMDLHCSVCHTLSTGHADSQPHPSVGVTLCAVHPKTQHLPAHAPETSGSSRHYPPSQIRSHPAPHPVSARPPWGARGRLGCSPSQAGPRSGPATWSQKRAPSEAGTRLRPEARRLWRSARTSGHETYHWDVQNRWTPAWPPR